MNDPGAQLAALYEVARGDDSWERRSAVAALSDHPDVHQSEHVLMSLLLDEHDVAVTERTADVLLARRDAKGLRLVGLALHAADEQQGYWLGDRLNDLIVGDLSFEPLERLAATLTARPDEASVLAGREIERALARLRLNLG